MARSGRGGEVRGDVGERVGGRDDPKPLAPGQLGHDVRLQRERRHVAVGGVRVLQEVLEPLSREVRVPAERLTEVRLRVAVDDQHPPAGLGEHRSEVRRRGRLRNSALVVGEHDREGTRLVFTDSSTSVYMYVYTSVCRPVFTSVWVDLCGDRHTASFWSSGIDWVAKSGDSPRCSRPRCETNACSDAHSTISSNRQSPRRPLITTLLSSADQTTSPRISG